MSSLKISSSIRNYDVFFEESIFNSLNSELRESDVIFVDEKVQHLFTDDIQMLIREHKHYSIRATEEQKSYVSLTPVIEKLIEDCFRKNNRLIAIGGGIVQDITAFIASIIYRGVVWLFYPTTLLAQADSCIGGKTSINIGQYKNQLGNFYPPSKIYIIPSVLKTLPDKDLKSGMGEMLHFYLVSGEYDFNLYEAVYDRALSHDEVLLRLIKRCLEIKKRFIEIDEFDLRERQLLNYGHSFGHAIESITNYGIPHGIAVSYGMDIANFISCKLGFLDKRICNRVRTLLEKIWAGTYIGHISVKDFEKALSRDKKNTNITYQLILTKGIGNMIKYGITPNKDFSHWLTEYFEMQSRQ